MPGDVKALIDKLNPVCRRALETAAGLCVAQTHFNVEVEHYLIELIAADGTDLQVVFRYYELDPARLLNDLNRAVEAFKRGNSRTPAFSPQLVELLEESWLAASVGLGAEAIRSGAVLKALLESKTLRPTIVESCPRLTDLSLERLREDLPELVRHSAEEGLGAAGGRTARPGGAAAPAPPSRAAARGPTPALDAYTVNLTAEARAGKIDPIRGRDREIRQVVDILTRRRQNNPILVGDAGVGKTAVAEGFALRVAAGEVPAALKGISVRILDLGLLQAGAGIKGEFEQRLKTVIEEVKAAPVPIILFVDEAHNLIGAGGAAGQSDAANLLKPALARGELRTIAATTWSEYKKYIEKDPALTRRFQLVRVEEPDEPAAIDMLRGVAARLAEHHAVRVLDGAVRDAVRLSARYLSERRLPDKAIGVLDTACARVALARDARPPQLEDLDRRLAPIALEIEVLERERGAGADHAEALARLAAERRALEAEREALAARWRRELELAREIAGLERELAAARETGTAGEGGAEAGRLAAEIARLTAECERLQGDDPMVPLAVDGRVVAAVVSGWTGIPVGRMLTDEIRGVLGLEGKMAERLIGQPQALAAISKRISTSRAELEDPGKPQGVFLLVGPSGVGKTETAVVLADLLYGGERNMVTLNMSEFQEPHSVATLKGSPPGYVGYGEGGVLTEAVRRRPYSVVLLDEAEKAHADVLELFYQVFDKGVLEDAEGVPVDFKNTILLLTTNLAAETIHRACAGKERPSPEKLLELVRPHLLKHFRPALLGRLAVVPYYPLGEADIRAIVELKLRKVQERIRRNHAAELTWDDDVVAEIAGLCTAEDTGARNIDHVLTNELLPGLSAELLERMAKGSTFSSIHLVLSGSRHFQFRINERSTSR
jgi:type VI secretion system protein VasG